MTTLVVQAHPLEESYSAALRAEAESALDAAGRPFECFRLAAGERPTPDDLVDATDLILVYPTWSGGLPALLLDWVHEVLDDDDALGGVRRVVVITTCGSSKLINLLQGEWGRRYLRRHVLAKCAPGARFRWHPLYKIDRRAEAETAAHLATIATAIAR